MAGSFTTLDASSIVSFASGAQVGYLWQCTNAGTGAGGWVTLPAVSGSGSLTVSSADTNLSVTLGGTPTTALLAAASIGVNWAGLLSVTRGGTGLNSCATGDIPYGSASNTLAMLPANATGTRKFLMSQSSGAPIWDILQGSDIGSIVTQFTSAGFGIAAQTNSYIATSNRAAIVGANYQLNVGGTYTGISGTTDIIDLNIVRTHTSGTGGITTSAGIQITPNTNATTAAITTSYGILINAGANTAGTVTTAYSAYITAPGFGTTKLALWTNDVTIGTGTAYSLMAMDANKNVVSIAPYSGGSATYVLTWNGTTTAPTWQVPTGGGGSGITSATGTANQILINGTTATQTTASTFTLPTSIIAPGSIQSTTTMAIATAITTTSGLLNAFAFTGAATTYYGYNSTGTISLTSSTAAQTAGLIISNTINCNGATITIGSGIINSPTLSNTSGTYTSAYAYYSKPTATATTTIGTYATQYLDTPTSSGTITTAYTAYYAAPPTAGTASVAVYAHSLQIGGTILAGNAASGNVNFGAAGIATSSLLATDGSKNLTTTTSGLSPTFTGLTLSGLTSTLVWANGSHVLAAVTLSANFAAGFAGTLDTVQGIQTTSDIQFNSIGIGVAAPATTGYARINVRLGVAMAPAYPLDITGNARFSTFVGIGNATPGTYTLDVTGNARFTTTLGIASATPSANIGLGNSFTLANTAGTSSYGEYNASNITATSGTTSIIASLGINSAIVNSSATTTTTVAGLLVTPSITNSTASSNITNPAGIYLKPIFTGTVTLTNVYGELIDTITSGGGTLTNAYGSYIKVPTAGTSSNTAIYADNMAIGTAATSPPTNGLLVLGSIKNTALSNSSLVATDGSQNLTSTTSGLSPTFTGLTLSGLTSTLIWANGSHVLAAVTLSANFAAGFAGTLDTVQGIQTTSTPQFLRLGITTPSNSLYGIYNSYNVTSVGTSNYSSYYSDGTYTVATAVTNVALYGAYFGNTFTTNHASAVLNNAIGVICKPLFTNTAGIFSNAISLYLDVPTITGTIATAYGIYNNVPVGATTNYGYYSTGTFTKVGDVGMNIFNTFTPAAAASNLYSFNNGPTFNTDTGSVTITNAYVNRIAPTFNITSNTITPGTYTTIYCSSIHPTITIPNAQTTAITIGTVYGQYIAAGSIGLGGNTSHRVTNYYGVYNATLPTITGTTPGKFGTVYGGYFAAPLTTAADAATGSVALWADSLNIGGTVGTASTSGYAKINARLGIAMDPSYPVDVTGNARFSTFVGIGNATPGTYTLDVTGNTRITTALGVGTTPPAGAGDVNINNSLGVGIAAPASAGYIQANARIGVAMAPTYPLDVTGNARFSTFVAVGNATPGTYMLDVTGNTRITTALGVGTTPPAGAGDVNINSSLGVGVAASGTAGTIYANNSLGVGVTPPVTAGYAQINARLGVAMAPTYPLDITGNARFSTFVAVGNATPGTYTLDVTGNARFTTNIGVNGSIPSVNSSIEVGTTFTATAIAAYGINMTGTITGQASAAIPTLYGINITSILKSGATQTGTVTHAGLNIVPAFDATSTTITNAYAVYGKIGTITSTVTNTVSGYFDAPTGGSNRVALWADSLQIGGTVVAGTAASGNVNFGAAGIAMNALLATDGTKNLTTTVSGLSPTFTGLTLSGLTSTLVWANGSHVLTTVTLSANFAGAFAGTLDTVQGIQTSSNPQFNALGIGVAAAGTAGSIYANNSLGVGITPPVTAGYAQISARLGVAMAPTYPLDITGNARFSTFVGIGNATPGTYTLDVTGNTRITTALGVGTTPPAGTGDVNINNSLGVGVAASGTAGTIYANVGLGVGVTPPVTAGYAQINARLGLASAPSVTSGFINALSFTGVAATYYAQQITSSFTYSSGSITQSSVLFIDGTAANITTTGGTISTVAAGVINNAKIINTSGSLPNAYGYYSLPSVTATTAMTKFASIYLDTPTITTGTNLPNAYGIYNNVPVGAVINTGYYQTGTFTKVGDVGLQFSNTFTPAAAATNLYNLYSNPTFNTSTGSVTITNTYVNSLVPTFNVTSNTTTPGTYTTIYCSSIQPAITIPNAQTTVITIGTVYGQYVGSGAIALGGSTSHRITNYYGIYNATLPTITGTTPGKFGTVYGGYFAAPLTTTADAATGSVALWADSLNIGGSVATASTSGYAKINTRLGVAMDPSYPVDVTGNARFSTFVAVGNATPGTYTLDVTGNARITTALGVGTTPPAGAGDVNINNSLGVGVAASGTAGTIYTNVGLGVGVTPPTTAGYAQINARLGLASAPSATSGFINALSFTGGGLSYYAEQITSSFTYSSGSITQSGVLFIDGTAANITTTGGTISSRSSGIINTVKITNTSGTLAAAYGYYSLPLFTGTTTIGSSASIYLDTPTIAGTITSGYGIYNNVPVGAGQNYGYYQTGTFVKANDIGFQLNNTFTPGATATNYAFINNPSMTIASGTVAMNNFYTEMISPTINVTSVTGAITFIGFYGINVTPSTVTINGAAHVLQNYYGIYSSSPAPTLAGGATITTAYSGYFATPGLGTVQIALYAANMAIGTIGVAPPTNGLLVAGIIKNTNLTFSRLVYTDASQQLASVTLAANLTLTTGTLDTVQGIQTSSTPQFAALGIAAAASASAYGIVNSYANASVATSIYYAYYSNGTVTIATGNTNGTLCGAYFGNTFTTNHVSAILDTANSIYSKPIFTNTTGQFNYARNLFLDRPTITGSILIAYGIYNNVPIGATTNYGYYSTGTFTKVADIGMYLNNTFTPTANSGTMYQSYMNPTFNTTTNTISNAFTLSLAPTFTVAGAFALNNAYGIDVFITDTISAAATLGASYGIRIGTTANGTSATAITNAYNLYLNGMTVSGSAVITNGIGIYNGVPVGAATNYGYYQTGTFTKAVDIGMQIANTFTPTADGGTLYQIYTAPAFNTTTNTIIHAYAEKIAPTFTIAGAFAMTNTYGLDIAVINTINAAATLGNSYGMRIGITAGGSSATAITYAYNLVLNDITTSGSAVITNGYGIQNLGPTGAGTNYGYYGGGTYTKQYDAGFYLNHRFTPTANSAILYEMYLTPGFTTSANDILWAYGAFINPTFTVAGAAGYSRASGIDVSVVNTINSTGILAASFGVRIGMTAGGSAATAITNAYNLYLNGMTVSGSAVITTGYGIYNSVPVGAATNYGYYQTGTFTKTGDIGMQINDSFTPTATASSLYEFYAGPTFTTTSALIIAAYAMANSPTFNCTSANSLNLAYASSITPTITVSSTGTVNALYCQAISPTINVTTATTGTALTSVFGLYVNPTNPTITTASVIVTNYYGIFSGTMGAKTGSGNFANAYSAYFAAPVTTATTTSSMALYATNASFGIGNVTISPPTNGILVQGNILNQSLTPNLLVGTDGSKNLTTTTSGISPTFAALTLTSPLTVANGGTGLNSCALGNVAYGSGTNSLTLLPGNIAATRMYLSQTGDGVNTAAPIWASISASDLGTTLTPQFTSIGLGTAAINESFITTASRSATSATTTWHIKLTGTTTGASTTTYLTGLGSDIINKANGGTLAFASQAMLTPNADATNNTITNNTALLINAATNVAGTVTNQYGIYNNISTFGTSNFGYYQAGTFIKSTDDGMILNDTFSPTTTTTNLTELSMTTTYNPTAGPYTVTAFYNQFINPTITITSASIITTTAYTGLNVTPAAITMNTSAHTIGDFYNIYSSIPAPTLANSATITRAYGGYFLNPSAGTSNVALYADSVLIGGTSVTTAMTAGTFKIGTTGAGVICAPSSLGISATAGFLYIPTLAGSTTGPTGGAPTSQSGTVPIAYDTDNNALLCYNSGWKPVGECLISRQVMANSSSTTVTFNNIPQHFNRLKVVIIAQAVSAAINDIYMTLNSGTSYDFEYYSAADATITSGSVYNTTVLQVGPIPGDTLTGATSKPIYSIVEIPEYSNTNWYKCYQAYAGYAAASSTARARQFTGSNRATAAITRIDFTVSSGGAFKQNSAFSLYGIV